MALIYLAAFIGHRNVNRIVVKVLSSPLFSHLSRLRRFFIAPYYQQKNEYQESVILHTWYLLSWGEKALTWVSAEHSTYLTAFRSRASFSAVSGVIGFCLFFANFSMVEGSSLRSIWVPTNRNGVFGQWWVISGTHWDKETLSYVHAWNSTYFTDYMPNIRLCWPVVFFIRALTIKIHASDAKRLPRLEWVCGNSVTDWTSELK